MEDKSLTRSPQTKKAYEYSNHKYLVIGRGLFGSATARHLATAGQDVLLVGADEPADWSAHTGVFASHYDEARIVSQSAPDELLQELDKASIAAYSQIESQSGITFFSPTGRITAQPADEPVFYPYLAKDTTACRQLSSRQIENNSPYRFPHNYTVIFENAPSGYLSPRNMVQAQTLAAKKMGAQIISGLVEKLNDCGSTVEAHLDDGRVISAEKMLIATGAFTNCFNLIEQKLAVRAETLVTILCEVSAETAVQHTDLSPLNYHKIDGDCTHISVLPPMIYPDGRHYIKLALTSSADRLLPDFSAISNWFRTDAKSFPYLEEMKQLMAQLLPSIEILSWKIKPCVAAYTRSFRPMIDRLVDNRIYVATGGNAGSAHPSDAIGKLAADLMQHNSWQSPLDHTPFQLQYAADHHAWMTEHRSVWSLEN